VKQKHHVEQVRRQNGGGTRVVSTCKLATKMDLIQTAKNLFFTDGICKYGNVGEFRFDMCDFKHSIMSDTVTVADLHEQYKMSNGKVKSLPMYHKVCHCDCQQTGSGGRR